MNADRAKVNCCQMLDTFRIVRIIIHMTKESTNNYDILNLITDMHYFVVNKTKSNLVNLNFEYGCEIKD